MYLFESNCLKAFESKCFICWIILLNFWTELLKYLFVYLATTYFHLSLAMKGLSTVKANISCNFSANRFTKVFWILWVSLLPKISLHELLMNLGVSVCAFIAYDDVMEVEFFEKKKKKKLLPDLCSGNNISCFEELTCGLNFFFFFYNIARETGWPQGSLFDSYYTKV